MSNQKRRVLSREFRVEAAKLITEKGYSIVNIDSTICLQKPKVQKHIPEMINTIAGVLNTKSENVSIKATTTENLGFVGREEGVSAYANVLIFKD